jgi:hypothetical protein
MPKLTLIPTKAAVDRKLAGFHQGKPLSLNFSKGENIDAVMHRFNEYRSPDNQIESLFTSANRPIPFATLLGSEDVQAYVS